MILGGGPAGSASALALARSGRDVALLERGHYDSVRVGETLPPESRRFLEALGVQEAFEAQGHLRSPGIVAIWGHSAPQENDFIFNPFGCGWHIARPSFDRMLAETAKERGARLHLGADASAKREDGSWRVRATSDDGALLYDADFVIDATGRAPLAFGPKRKKETHDKLVALVGFGASARPEDARTILEATELGWWYAATLPGGKLVATFTTDPSLVGRAFRGLFRDELAKTRLVKSWVADLDAIEVSAVRCATYLRAPVVKDGWVAVGDAASAYDPLSSLGICKALETGLRAAEALVAGRVEEDYAAWVRSSFEQYLATRKRYYALERRWPRSPFWSVRSGR